VVESASGRTEFHVQASPLVDRRHRDLGWCTSRATLTQANLLSRRLAAGAHPDGRAGRDDPALRAGLVELASRDSLTGLHNRRHLVERFAALLAAAAAAGDALAVVLFDLDEFKSVNDQYGHLAGDAVLVAFAQRIGERAPPTRWWPAGRGGVLRRAARRGRCGGPAYADDVRRQFERTRSRRRADGQLHGQRRRGRLPGVGTRWTACSTPPTPRCTRPRARGATS